jgi:hypothetical protein
MGDGSESTVTENTDAHPVGKLYEIRAVPKLIPPTIPVVDPTVATPVLLLLQVPPPGP